MREYETMDSKSVKQRNLSDYFDQCLISKNVMCIPTFRSHDKYIYDTRGTEMLDEGQVLTVLGTDRRGQLH